MSGWLTPPGRVRRMEINEDPEYKHGKNRGLPTMLKLQEVIFNNSTNENYLEG